MENQKTKELFFYTTHVHNVQICVIHWIFPQKGTIFLRFLSFYYKMKEEKKKLKGESVRPRKQVRGFWMKGWWWEWNWWEKINGLVQTMWRERNGLGKSEKRTRWKWRNNRSMKIAMIQKLGTVLLSLYKTSLLERESEEK